MATSVCKGRAKIVIDEIGPLLAHPGPLVETPAAEEWLGVALVVVLEKQQAMHVSRRAGDGPEQSALEIHEGTGFAFGGKHDAQQGTIGFQDEDVGQLSGKEQHGIEQRGMVGRDRFRVVHEQQDAFFDRNFLAQHAQGENGFVLAPGPGRSMNEYGVGQTSDGLLPGGTDGDHMFGLAGGEPLFLHVRLVVAQGGFGGHPATEDFRPQGVDGCVGGDILGSSIVVKGNFVGV